MLGMVPMYGWANANKTIAYNWEKILVPVIWPIIIVVGGIIALFEWLKEANVKY